MSSFLIEVPHGNNKEECNHAIKVFLESGSHFLSNADWGCKDNQHKAWLRVDVEDKEAALRIIPPLYRSRANIIQLNKYTKEEMLVDAKLHGK
jgi:hypothetical protein